MHTRLSNTKVAYGKRTIQVLTIALGETQIHLTTIPSPYGFSAINAPCYAQRATTVKRSDINTYPLENGDDLIYQLCTLALPVPCLAPFSPIASILPNGTFNTFHHSCDI